MRVFVVAYDIADDRRRSRVASALEGFGRRVQYSVFLCELSDAQLVRLRSALHRALKHDEDQVLFFRLGPVGELTYGKIDSIGLAFSRPDSGALVL